MKIKRYMFAILKYVLLIELAFTILYPMFTQLASSFMSKIDIADQTVRYFSKQPSLDNYRYLIKYTNYYESLLNSVVLCFCVSVLTMLVSSFAGYGLAKFKFVGKWSVFSIVMLSIIIPPQTVMLSLFVRFRYFDIFGIFSAISGDTLKLTGSLLPVMLLAVTGFGFRGGLFIVLMRQFYKGVPNELMEAAYVDGANVYRTYYSIIFPLGRTVMITVLLLSFSWMWTDTFYANILYPGVPLVSKIIAESRFIGAEGVQVGTLLSGMYINTATILVLMPLLLIFVFGQKLMVEGIERSGITG